MLRFACSCLARAHARLPPNLTLLLSLGLCPHLTRHVAHTQLTWAPPAGARRWTGPLRCTRAGASRPPSVRSVFASIAPRCYPAFRFRVARLAVWLAPLTRRCGRSRSVCSPFVPACTESCDLDWISGWCPFSRCCACSLFLHGNLCTLRPDEPDRAVAARLGPRHGHRQGLALV